MSRKKTPPTCHPDRLVKGLGLCSACYNKRWKKCNPDKVRLQEQRRRKKYPDKYSAKYKKWQQANKEKIRVYAKKYRQENPEKVKQWANTNYLKNRDRKLAYSSVYQKSNPEKSKEKRRRWYANNPERAAEIKRAYRKNNPTKIAAEKAVRRARLLSAPTDGSVTPEVLKHLKSISVCHYCQIETTVLERTVDHRVPLTRGGAHATHNLVMACRTCNNRKCAKTDVEFFALLAENRLKEA